MILGISFIWWALIFLTWAFFVLITIMFARGVSVSEKRHKALLRYIYESALKRSEDIKPPSPVILNPGVKPKKGTAYIPSRDMDQKLGGKIVDPFD